MISDLDLLLKQVDFVLLLQKLLLLPCNLWRNYTLKKSLLSGGGVGWGGEGWWWPAQRSVSPSLTGHGWR